jgi:hypothetical protein
MYFNLCREYSPCFPVKNAYRDPLESLDISGKNTMAEIFKEAVCIFSTLLYIYGQGCSYMYCSHHRNRDINVTQLRLELACILHSSLSANIMNIFVGNIPSLDRLKGTVS